MFDTIHATESPWQDDLIKISNFGELSIEHLNERFKQLNVSSKL
jgi:hypothetical protein